MKITIKYGEDASPLELVEYEAVPDQDGWATFWTMGGVRREYAPTEVQQVLWEVALTLKES